MRAWGALPVGLGVLKNWDSPRSNEGSTDWINPNRTWASERDAAFLQDSV